MDEDVWVDVMVKGLQMEVFRPKCKNSIIGDVKKEGKPIAMAEIDSRRDGTLHLIVQVVREGRVRSGLMKPN